MIRGDPRLGKSHLLHAIGRELSRRHRGMRVAYTSTETFVDAMLGAIGTGGMGRFHHLYRSADVLLVDDIEMMTHPDHAREELLDTFGELHRRGGRAVVASERPTGSRLSEIQGQVCRTGRWRVADVRPCDVRTKLRIFARKVQSKGINLPADVRLLIACRTGSNLREMEGALARVTAWSSVTGIPITLASVRKVLTFYQ